MVVPHDDERGGENKWGGSVEAATKKSNQETGLIACVRESLHRRGGEGW